MKRTKQSAAGFTIVELLSTMAVILILVGMILGLVNLASTKSANPKPERISPSSGWSWRNTGWTTARISTRVRTRLWI